MTMRSGPNEKKDWSGLPHRALYCAAGVPRPQWGNRLIGLATPTRIFVPGHVGMRALERGGRKRAFTRRRVPFLFGRPGRVRRDRHGHRGMHFSLRWREIVADLVESVAEAHALDGLVLLTNCDKITPGMLMAAARLDIRASS